jgi:hypothetical protein
VILPFFQEEKVENASREIKRKCGNLRKFFFLGNILMESFHLKLFRCFVVACLFGWGGRSGFF